MIFLGDSREVGGVFYRRSAKLTIGFLTQLDRELDGAFLSTCRGPEDRGLLASRSDLPQGAEVKPMLNRASGVRGVSSGLALEATVF